MYQKYFKRPLDFIMALLGLIILSPLLLIVAILVRIKLGSPVIFKQPRPGLNEEIFTLYKFRTMTDERDENGELLPDEVRLTSFGKFLRSTSLDELPELWNILKGDMSFVGPRPQLVKDMVFMTPEQRRRHNVRPGLTGWAQVNGRNNISWEDKLSLDLEYLECISLMGDIKIMGKTVIKVVKRDGVATEGMETAEDFGDYLLRTGKVDYEQYIKKIDNSNALIGLG
jgi:undecaprenyl phosphate N,N'-diacetylbacillosamine 1-phosphate transferase